MSQACALVVASESCLTRVGGATSLKWVVAALRAEPRVIEVHVLTQDDAVRRAAAELGVNTLSAAGQVPISVKQNSGFDAVVEEVALFPVRPSLALERVLAPGANEQMIHAAVRSLMERGRYAALLVVNADKALLEVSDVGALLDAVRNCRTAALVSGPQRCWFEAENAGHWLRGQAPGFSELEVAHAVHLHTESSLCRVLPVPPELGWSVSQEAQRLGIDAVLRSRHHKARFAALPARVAGLVMDFDGVFTDNAVIVSQSGEESVRCSRGDGLGLSLLRAAGLPMVVISKETNPVVAARCKKLNIPALSGVDEKLPRLIQWAEQNRLAREQVVYVGNDVNDLECLSWAGCGVAVADSHRQVLDIADVILESKGGCGALRELADELAGRIQGVFPVVPSSGRA